MKVSSGKWRGRSLLSPQGQNVRPTAGLVKEALMDMLGARLPGASVLELFCGTGQLGIEALSRGAAACVFADSSPASLYEALEREIDRCGLLSPDGVLVLEHDKALTPSTLPCYEILRSRAYGRRSLLLLTPNKEA